VDVIFRSVPAPSCPVGFLEIGYSPNRVEATSLSVSSSSLTRTTPTPGAAAVCTWCQGGRRPGPTKIVEEDPEDAAYRDESTGEKVMNEQEQEAITDSER
jgi:hypothetical protein